jgi:hypothetical protein
MTAAPSRSLALSSDFGLSLRSVDAFQRVLAYLPVGASVPPATALSLAPLAINAGMGVERRAHNSVLTFGLRLDGTAPGGGSGGLRLGVSPRLGWALSLDAITLTTSLSRVSEFPDAQFLNDVAFDDTTTAGRFRRGDATLEDESALLGEIGVRMRTGRGTFAIRAFVKRFSGLVAADSLPADPDSSVLGNRDHGDVMGADVRLEQRFHRVAVSVSFALQTTSFQSAYGLRRSSAASPLDQDRPQRLAVVVRSPLPGAVDFATFARFESGRPYSPVGPTGQIIGGAPNGARLPSWFGIDVTLQRPFHAGSREGRLILDVRNILNRRNIIAVRRTTGTPGLSAAAIDSLAQAAYAAHPDPIPYDSPAYRAAADLDGNGLIEGSSELLPLFQAAARDYANPLMAYGPPRLFRLGLAFSL